MHFLVSLLISLASLTAVASLALASQGGPGLAARHEAAVSVPEAASRRTPSPYASRPSSNDRAVPFRVRPL